VWQGSFPRQDHSKTAQRCFTIGAPNALAAIFLGPLVACVAREAPAIPSSAAYAATSRQTDERSLADQTYGDRRATARYCGSSDRRAATSFAERLLFEEDFVIAIRKGHPLARRPSLAAYLAARHMLVSAIGDVLGAVDAKLAEKGLSRRVALMVPFAMKNLERKARPAPQSSSELPDWPRCIVVWPEGWCTGEHLHIPQ
jgi:DNA-binding transcriptional LysR family regulator